MSHPVIFITAAEASGDAHAAGLILALRRRLGQAQFVGVGGPRMAQAGCRLVAQPVERAAMTTSAIAQAPYFWKVIRTAAAAMSQLHPAVHVPVDSPALNWHLAKAARRRGIPVAYYIAPQVWAWAPWRVKKLRRLTDAVACILPFEEQYLRSRGVNARYVGHPVFDNLPPAQPPDLAAAAAAGDWRIALLPGSRPGVIRHHAPALALVMDRLRAKFPKAQFSFVASDEQAAGRIDRAVGDRPAGAEKLPIVVGPVEETLSGCNFAVATSGTVTLQVAHFGLPMVIFYHVRRLAWPIGKLLIRTRYLSAINILAGRELAPELMPWFGDAEALAERAINLLENPTQLAAQQRELLELVAPLRVNPPGSAADNAADLVIRTAGLAGQSANAPS